MLKPICVPCQRFFRVKKNGFAFIEGMPIVNGALPGLAEPAKWQPYKLWLGDRWECEGCHAVIVSGVGQAPLAIQHEEDFAAQVERRGATLQINDC